MIRKLLISAYIILLTACTPAIVNMTKQSKVNVNEVATLRICNYGELVKEIDGNIVGTFSQRGRGGVALVEPGNHKVLLSGIFGYGATASATGSGVAVYTNNRETIIDLPTKAGKVYTFHYKLVGNAVVHSFKERELSYSTSCDIKTEED